MLSLLSLSCSWLTVAPEEAAAAATTGFTEPRPASPLFDVLALHIKSRRVSASLLWGRQQGRDGERREEVSEGERERKRERLCNFMCGAHEQKVCT